MFHFIVYTVVVALHWSIEMAKEKQKKKKETTMKQKKK